MPLAAAVHWKHHIVLLVHRILSRSVLSPAVQSRAIVSNSQLHHTNVPVPCYVFNTCSCLVVAKKFHRLLRAGNIQVYHLRAKDSDSERRGAHNLGHACSTCCTKGHSSIKRLDVSHIGVP